MFGAIYCKSCNIWTKYLRRVYPTKDSSHKHIWGYYKSRIWKIPYIASFNSKFGALTIAAIKSRNFLT